MSYLPGQPFLLGSILSLALVVSGKVALDPGWGKPAHYQFPAVVPLADWSVTESHPISTPITIDQDQKGEIAGNQYRYQQQQLSLQVRVYYITNSRGDIGHDFFNTTKPLMISQTRTNVQQQRSKFGFYNTFQSQDKSYLYSCINASGASTVNSHQFQQNRQAEILSTNRFLLALIGLKDLRDQRCLWTEMSVSTSDTSQVVPKQTLMVAWEEWHQWWQSNFPEL